MLKEQRKKLPRKGAVKIFEDGREVCDLGTTEGSRIYKERTKILWLRQHGACAICGHYTWEPTFDHEAGRGAGKRDDRIFVNGQRKNAALCEYCNSLKGSKRYKWVDGKYIEIKRVREVCMITEWIATGALVFIAWRVFLFSRDFSDFTKSLPIINANLVLNPQIVEFFTNFRRNKPRAKKEKAFDGDLR